MTDTSLTDADKTELRLLYQTSVEDIRFFKRQQIAIANYGGVLYAVIFAISGQLIKVYDRFDIILGILATLVAVFGWAILDRLQRALVDARRSSVKARKSFSSSFKAAANAHDEENVLDRKPGDLDRTLQTILVVGALLVISLLMTSH